MATGGNHFGQDDSFLSAFRDVLGLRLPVHNRYAAWEECAIEGSWRTTHHDFCMVSDFPLHVKMDEQARPHCETGPSHLWRDGWALYYWHGVSVPREWIEDRNQVDPSLALTWSNIEQRRCLAEILGWERVLQQLQPRTLQEDWTGELLEVDLPDSPRQRFARVRCATGRIFVLPVDRKAKTCLEAVARTYRVTPEQYAQLQART